MIRTVIDERLRTVSLALAQVRADRSYASHAGTQFAQRAVAAARSAADRQLVELLRRYFHASREFLVYGHALALGPAPAFEREAGRGTPTYLIAMPALLGAAFPKAMSAFHADEAVRGFFAETHAEWESAKADLDAAVARLDIARTMRQWFPDATLDIQLLLDLTGLPGQVIATYGEGFSFACAPSTGQCKWDPAHIGSAILSEVARPLIEAAVKPDEASQIAGRLEVARVLAQVRDSGQPQSLKQSFLLVNPDFRTRLIEIIARALVSVSLGRSLGRTVARAYLNEQESAVGGEVVERVANAMQRHLRLAPRTSLRDFLSRSVAELEAPLFARAAGN
ncbi:MAG: hypothetical protein ACM3XN_09605 [Chloroflexota bacterium]